MHEIIERIKELDEEKAELEAALAEAKVAMRDGLVQDIRDIIADAGFTVDEILPMVAPPAKKAKGDGRAFPMYALASDPSVTYSRGVLSEKIKAAMVAAGMDPAMGADRSAFKAKYMVQV